MGIVDNILYVLGGESSGKSTLVHQIQAMSVGAVMTQPVRTTPTTGQNVSTCKIKSEMHPQAGEAIEIREIGGSMSAHWNKFLRSSIEHEGYARRALIYVLDASAPHQLCEATTRFLQLTMHPGECKGWPAVLVLHKSHAAHAVSLDDVRFFFGGLSPSSIQILEVDAWNGYGVGDLFDWVQTMAFGA